MKKSGRKEETIHSRLRSCRAHKNFIRWVVLGVFLLCAVCIVYPFSPQNEQPAGSVKMVVLLPGENRRSELEYRKLQRDHGVPESIGCGTSLREKCIRGGFGSDAPVVCRQGISVHPGCGNAV